ncbi:MAG: DHA2 family efflux MFS transporter permease subunit [Clostridiales bacterium]|nr:DHA2 family efflux MFS transporter permease subunit [Clostridiales bacterium]
MNNKNKRKNGNGALLFVLLAGMFVNLLNVSIINVMLPKIMDQYQVSAAVAQWLSTGFMLSTGIVVMLVPFLSKKLQYKTLFNAAMAFLVAGSLVCFAAPTFPVLLAGRLIQSVGYGLLLPLAMIIVLATAPPEKRGASTGVMGIGMLFAPAVGPTLAGIAINYLSWKYLYLIMAGSGAVVIAVSLMTFHYHSEKQEARPDAIGIILSAAGLSSLLHGISSAGGNGWNNASTIVFAAVGAALLAAFAIVELKTKNPLLDLRVFKDYNFTSNVMVTMVLTMAFYGGLILMPLYFENVMGYSGLKTGLMLLPGSLLIGIMGLLSGKVYDKIGIKPLAITGTLVMAAAACFLARLAPDTPYMQSVLSYTVFALGVSIVTTPITTAAFSKVPKERNSDAATLQNALRQVAGAVGTAIIVTAMSNSAKGYHGIQAAFVLTVILCLLAAAMSLFLVPNRKPHALLPQASQRGRCPRTACVHSE